MRYRRTKYQFGGDPIKKKVKQELAVNTDLVGKRFTVMPYEQDNEFNDERIFDTKTKLKGFLESKAKFEELGMEQFMIDKVDSRVKREENRLAELVAIKDALFIGPQPMKGNRQERKYGGVIGSVLGGAAGLAIGNPMLGASLGNSVGTAVDGSMEAKRLAQQEQQRYLKSYQDSITVNNSNNLLNPTNGFYGAEGGSMPLAVTNSPDVIKAGKTSGKFKGEDHEQGGIPIDFDNDGSLESEVEDGEVFNEEKLYSKRLKFSPEYETMSKDYNMKAPSKGSYADEADRLTKKMAKYEEMASSRDSATKNTGEIMLERIENLLNMLFEDQELKKIKRNIA